MATFEKRIGTNGKITYRVKIRVHGKPTYTATFDRKTDAKDWSRDTESSLKAGRYVPTTEARRRTIADMIDRYLAETLPNKKQNKDQSHTKNRLVWWREQIGDYSLDSVTPGVISDQKSRLLARKNRYGNTLSQATINRYLAAISHVFKTAKNDWHWIDKSPVANVSRGAESKGRIRFLDEDERNRLLEACRESQSEDLYTIVVLALSTGMRKGEILGMTWRNVDLTRRLIILEDTKNDERRAVPIVSHALQLIKEKNKVRRIDTDYVFPAKSKNVPMNFDTAWRQAMKRADIENYRFHDNRHSAASYLLSQGATLGQLAEILGHKTLQMVKRYSHLTQDHATKLVEDMNETVFGGM